MSCVSRLLELWVVGVQRRRAVRGLAGAGSLMAALLIAGCGGGVSFYFGDCVPADGRASVTVFAHAVDNAGNAADSNLVTIAITP